MKVTYKNQIFEIDDYTIENIEQLKERIRLGNKKLLEAWDKLMTMDHSSQIWKDSLEQWHLANEKLSYYCSQLKNLGFEDCLYITEIDGKKEKTKTCLEDGIGCRVCPSQYPYWEEELMKLPSPKVKNPYQGKTGGLK